MKLGLFTFLAFIIFFLGCQEEKESNKDFVPVFSKNAKSKLGMVSSSHPLASKVGVSILEQGGNAADAATAMAFALAVVEPAMSGLGGRLQAIIRTADGEIHGIDATTQAPMTYDQAIAPQAKYGYAVIGVPGMVAGVSKLNKRFGVIPLADLINPAIKIAEEGFYQLPQQEFIQNMVKEQVLEFKGSTRYFINSGDSSSYGPSELFVQKDLAKSLKLIADQGSDVFYNGEIADKMTDDITDHGGALTKESLADYEALNSEILHGSYRGYDIHGLWMPSFGAITIEILHILENLPMSDLSEAERASAISQAITLAYTDREKQNSLDTGMMLISKEYAKIQAEKINIGEKVEVVISDSEQPLAWTDNPGHTTHLSVADKDGMIVSLTQSLGPAMGSKVATPGLGFLYASTLGGYLGPMEPGQRAASHISPIIITKDGQPVMGIGAAGGARIPTAIVQVISRIIDSGMTPLEALTAPRIHPSNDGVILEMHDTLAWNQQDLNFLKANGFVVEEEKQIFRFGRVHVVVLQNDTWIGAADPDGEGVAIGQEDTHN